MELSPPHIGSGVKNRIVRKEINSEIDVIWFYGYTMPYPPPPPTTTTTIIKLLNSWIFKEKAAFYLWPQQFKVKLTQSIHLSQVHWYMDSYIVVYNIHLHGLFFPKETFSFLKPFQVIKRLRIVSSKGLCFGTYCGMLILSFLNLPL